MLLVDPAAELAAVGRASHRLSLLVVDASAAHPVCN